MTTSRKKFPVGLLLSILVAPSFVFAQEGYRLPSPEVVDILTAPTAPEVSVSPDGEWMVITHLYGMPSISDRAVPMARLAGDRVNIQTNGPYNIKPYDLHSSYTGTGIGYSVIRFSDGSERELAVPNAKLGPPLWSPDSSHFAFLQTTGKGITLWVTDIASGESRSLSGANINAARSIDGEADNPCTWMSDSENLLCHFVPADRAPAPPSITGPQPVAQETDGIKSPVWTFTNLLTSPLDEASYDYYMTTQPAFVNVNSSKITRFGRAGVYEKLQPSADGQYFLSVRIERPYSYLVPANRFPKSVEILGRSGKVVRDVTQTATNNSGPTHLGWTADGGRDFVWRSGLPAALMYVEPLDNGNPKQEAEYRDRVLILSAPFSGKAVELMRTKSRIVSSDDYRSSNGLKFWENNGLALVTEFDWGTRQASTWLIDTNKPGVDPTLVWAHNKDNWYGHPGVPVISQSKDGEPVLRQDGDWIFLIGQGGSDDGDHPFVDRFNIKTRETQRLFQSEGRNYENVVAVLDPDGSKLITRYESTEEPPTFHLRDLDRDSNRALTKDSDPDNGLSRARKQRVSYVRKDGVPLSGNLYLPEEYKEGETVPVVVWAYPLEYANKKGAGQVRGSTYKFSGKSTSVTTDYMLFLTQGYAVLADASMPIVGGLEANDTYVEQLVDNAQAAVDNLVEMGVADRNRIGIAGLSYGAFMTANLLANSDIFAAGIAMNGAYNRTLTPFGFQAERRTFWEAPDIYFKMSTFMHADQINEPLLMFHGEIDSNTGTYPIQSRRLYHALKGLGGTARLVMLPHEDHIYAARETRLHVFAEMVAWFDRYVKNAE